MPLSLVLSAPSSPADALRADLALQFPGVWLRPAAADLDSAWLERQLLEAAVRNGVPLEWVRVLCGAAGQGSAIPENHLDPER